MHIQISNYAASIKVHGPGAAEIAVIHSHFTLSCWEESKLHKEAWFEIFQNSTNMKILYNSPVFQDLNFNLTNSSE